MEEAIGAVGIFVAEDGVGEGREGGVRVVVFVETTRDFAVLVGAEKERLIFASFVVVFIKFIDDGLSFG